MRKISTLFLTFSVAVTVFAGNPENRCCSGYLLSSNRQANNSSSNSQGTKKIQLKNYIPTIQQTINFHPKHQSQVLKNNPHHDLNHLSTSIAIHSNSIHESVEIEEEPKSTPKEIPNFIKPEEISNDNCHFSFPKKSVPSTQKKNEDNELSDKENSNIPKVKNMAIPFSFRNPAKLYCNSDGEIIFENKDSSY